jgi:hypothetical protein
MSRSLFSLIADAIAPAIVVPSFAVADGDADDSDCIGDCGGDSFCITLSM